MSRRFGHSAGRFRSPTIIEVRPCGKARGSGVSSFRAYACGEEGQVRIDCQERPLKIPLIRKPRMSGAPGRLVCQLGVVDWAITENDR